MKSVVRAIVAAVLMMVAAPVQAAPPLLLSYQGYLADSVGNPVTGEWTVEFAFFKSEQGGEPFFEETRQVECELGIFSTMLGDDPANPVEADEFEQGETWLQLTLETDAGPVALLPRQRIVSTPYSWWSAESQKCEQAGNADQLGGTPAGEFITVQEIPGVCITPDNLETYLDQLGYTPGGSYGDEEVAAFLLDNGYYPCACYGDEQVAAFLLANGYLPGGGFSGNFVDLKGVPPFVTGPQAVQAGIDSGKFLLADGTVPLTGSLDAAGNQIYNLVVHNAALIKPPKSPKAGQLWWNTTDKTLEVFDGTAWVLAGGGMAADLACQGCVDPDDVSFPFAAAAGKAGDALNTLDVTCTQCVSDAEVSFPWAKGTVAGGDALKALTADSAANVTCAACVQIGEIDPAALKAKWISFDDTVTNIGATTVQSALEKVVAGGAAGGFQEGNGTIVPYVEQWGLPAYGEARTFLHLMNPATPKVVMHLYAGEASGFATSNNLVVAYAFAPNNYSGDINGTAGQKALQVGNPSIFTISAHVLLHQTVGTGGNGTDAGRWELNQVTGIEGSTILLVKPLAYSYKSCGDECGRAQAVVAASYNQIEVVNGGSVYPALSGVSYTDRRGSILYIRARKIVVKTGGKIHADGFSAYPRGDNWGGSNEGERASSECKIIANQWGTAANCSGGGGGPYNKGGAGGGGNKTAGQNGTANGGQGGGTHGDADLNTLHFGGSGGAGCANYGGSGGGIIVLGAESIIVEQGASITANGNNGDCIYGSNDYAGGGGGAGGSVVLLTNELINNGTVAANPGTGSCAGNQFVGGKGGDGWIINKPPLPGVVNESFAKGVSIVVDGKDVTAAVGDPNAKGPPSWDAAAQKWGADGLHEWSTGPLDLTSTVPWTLGEHSVTFKETGGAGGDLKMFLYVIYPFSKSAPPVNDTCATPAQLNLADAVTVSATTEDIMGKIKATDANQGPFCGGSGGPDVVYQFKLGDWRQLAVTITSAFTPRMYIKKGNCANGSVVACGQESTTTSVLEPGTYFLFVDGDGNMQKGDFTLNIVPSPPGPPPNDSCAAPEGLIFQGGTAQVNGMTLFSKNDHQAPCGGANAPENVYSFDVPGNVTKLSVTLTPDNYSPVMYLAKDSCTAAPIACIPGASYEMGWPGQGKYYLFVDGKTAADKGLYTLKVTLQ